MDKSWMSIDRRLQPYWEGVEQFLVFAKSHVDNQNCIRCPCTKCVNLKWLSIKDVRDHLYFHGIDQMYQTWVWHGEEVSCDEGVNCEGIFHDQLEGVAQNDDDGRVEMEPTERDVPEDVDDAVDMVQATYNRLKGDPDKFKKLLEDAEKLVYPGCKKYSKLSALVNIYNMKAKNSWSDKSFSELLKFLQDILPDDNEIPLSSYHTKTTLMALGLEYEKIHACPNDCILYRKEYKDADTCPTCGMSRWKANEHTGSIRNEVPAKVLWYFPPIPRFINMFQSIETAKKLVWHDQERIKDGKLHHPTDSPAWKLVDNRWPDFAAEPQNLRLALSADGINPYTTYKSSYSCWPVLMVTYNLPPWLCMKRKFMMLTLLISGPKQPGNDIDVYLEPLIDDLKLLWDEGVNAYDANQKNLFTLKAILLWTINDFPAYGMLSGYVVKGRNACPICNEYMISRRLKHGKKHIYACHRIYLPLGHRFRKQKKAFDGEQESRLPPKPLTEEQILRKVEGIQLTWGKKNINFAQKGKSKKISRTSKGKQDQTQNDSTSYWKKKSKFFELGYWKFLMICHNLDVMHIEKNVCESIIGTLLNIPGKTKDGLNSRLDLAEMGLRKELAPSVGEKRTYLPPACFTLSRAEKEKFCKTLFQLKVPDGYSSNFRNNVSMKDLKILNLKSHDYHTLMQ